MKQTALILGGTGRFGRHATQAFKTHRWDVRQFDRKSDNLWDAAWGAQVIVAAWNPAYPDWASQLPALHAQIREVAKASGATVIIPGNVYVFGSGAPARLDETTPHAARNPLGRIRTEMEHAYRDEGIRTIVLRAGDFLDDRPSGNWFDMQMAKTLPRGRLTYPGRLDAAHAWAWLPDMARAAVALAEKRHELAPFEDVPFPGYTLTGNEMAAGLAQVMQRPIKAARMSWLPLRIARPFWKMAAPLFEMRYLWSMPHELSAAKFDRLLPGFAHTPPNEALAQAVWHLEIDPDKPVPAGKQTVLA